MRRSGCLAALVGLALVGACSSGGGGSAALVLDGRPRVPSDQGVVTAVSDTALTLDSARTYRVSPSIQVFSTNTFQALPLAGRQGQYVQIGAHGTTVDWVASFSVVARLPGSPPTAFYIGVFLRTDSRGRAVFRDGTIVTLAPGVAPPAPNSQVRADIDPALHAARDLKPA